MLRLIACMLVFLAPAVTGASAPANEIATAGTTPARLAGERFLEAMQADASTEDFVAANFAKSALEREPAAARAKAFDGIKAQTGGFEVLEWRPQGERMVDILVRSRKGDRHAKIVLFTSRAEPDRISQIFVLSERDPARANADRFPQGTVAEGEVIRLVLRRLDALTEEGGFSGAVLIGRGDRVLLRGARGLADETWQVPNAPDTRFNIASIGKMWTAVVVMKLVEEGLLLLDDPLAKWVDTFPHRQAAENITLRQLLQHRGNLGPWDGRAFREPMRPSQAAATMTSAPGAIDGRFAYSNAGYVLLGAAAEKASGKSYEELVRAYVFEPAGMSDSGFWPVSQVVPNRATGYLRPPHDPLGFGPRFANDQYLGFSGDPSGGAYSTVEDLFRFHRALALGRLLRPESNAAMLAEPVEFAGAPRPWRYGLGLRLEECAGVPTLGHGGGGANSGVSGSTHAGLDGEWTVIVLGNVDPMPEQLAFDVCELVHRAER